MANESGKNCKQKVVVKVCEMGNTLLSSGLIYRDSTLEHRISLEI